MSPSPSIVVLASGGLDSTVLLTSVVNEWSGPDDVLAVSVDYGQRHGRRELAAARDVTANLKVRHIIVSIDLGRHLPGSALTDASVAVPDGHYADATMAATVVPARNLTMLSVASGIADAHGATHVATAVHAGDHPVYPDCRPGFIDAAARAISESLGGRVKVIAPYLHWTKTDIVRAGHDLGAPMALTWSCYKGGGVHCGTCGTCTERMEAFRDSDVPDPTVYLGGTMSGKRRTW